MREIRQNITSDNIDVLEQSLTFAWELSSQERERGRVAETRATTILAALGILAGFIVPLIQSLDKVSNDSKWALLVMLVGAASFLLKGLYYAIRVLGVSKNFRVSIESIYDLQSLSRVDALREQIACLIWEHKMNVKPNNEKLFRLHRSQRNGLVAMTFFVIFGLLLLITMEQWTVVPQCAAYSFAVATVILILFVDPLVENMGLWNGK